MSDESFRVLQDKYVYEFLEGSGKGDLVLYKDQEYGLPYLTGNTLMDYCKKFGVDEVPDMVRWAYVEDLLDFAIHNNCCDEVLNYFFDLSHFRDLNDLSNLDEIQEVHQRIVKAAVEHINYLIRLTKHKLRLVNGHFYIAEVGKEPELLTTKLDKFSLDYVSGLRQRCKDDLLNGNYDSVITKSRTMLEETFIHIIEKAQAEGIISEEPNRSGDLIKLFNQVKSIRNMQQSKENDKRVNELLSGLEKIVNSIANMRNTMSDAHGVGEKRIRINAKEARLVMNCSMTLCEYLVSKKENN